MQKRILLSGGAGFVAHHFVEHFIKNTDWHIVIIDRLNYSGSLDRLRDINVYDDKRITILTADFTLPIVENLAKEIGEVDYIFHIGAESHVDNSISDPLKFAHANVIGTVQMLNFARTLPNLKCFYYFSTDEVFGSIAQGMSEVGDPHNPSNPYAAGKSGGEMFCKAFANTYKMPIVITRSMNIAGERQDKEKFIPMIIRKVELGETVTIHANPDKTKAGSRFYIHARNVADGYMHLINSGITSGEFHITGEKEVDNLQLAKDIAEIMGKELKYEMVDFHSSRPGHDLRYALSPKSMADIGWTPPHTYNQWLRKIVEWSLRPENRHWVGL